MGCLRHLLDRVGQDAWAGQLGMEKSQQLREMDYRLWVKMQSRPRNLQVLEDLVVR